MLFGVFLELFTTASHKLAGVFMVGALTQALLNQFIFKLGWVHVYFAGLDE